ncbi:MAG: transcriptional regulator NrdR [Euryarchaeota archaeon]|nr:transcriptional regulator NrdR [Euryarchaeota archaeon]
MKCCYCSYGETKVVDTRESEKGSFVRRRRECIKCGKRFTTYERVERSFVVVKRDGREEQYQRDKLVTGIKRACEKRLIPDGSIEGVADELENELQELGRKEIKSEKIGVMVMERLKNLDPVAYMRFASVYKDFDDLDSFKKEIEKLREE